MLFSRGFFAVSRSHNQACIMSSVTPLLCLLSCTSSRLMLHSSSRTIIISERFRLREMPVGLSTNAANPIKSESVAFLSRIRREEFYNGLFIFGIPQITDMSAVWKERHLVAQRRFERFDGLSLGQEIIDVVQE